MEGGYSWEQQASKGPREAERKREKTDAERILDKKLYLDSIIDSAGPVKSTEKAMIRYMTLIIDMSTSMEKKTDFSPNRLAVTKKLLSSFIASFFDQNPLSLMGVIVTMKGRAMILSDFMNSPQEHAKRLQDFEDLGGDPSLQNSLELAITNANLVPSNLYASNEILIISSGLNTSDPSNLTDTIDDLSSKNMRVSIVSLSSELYILT